MSRGAHDQHAGMFAKSEKEGADQARHVAGMCGRVGTHLFVRTLLDIFSLFDVQVAAG